MRSGMSAAVETVARRTGEIRVGAFQKWVPILFFSVLWFDLFRLLSYTWQTREQYAYGWFVPLFALFLLWGRNADRPAPRKSPPHPGITIAMLLVAALLLPARILFEVNPDWPLVAWPYTVAVVLLSVHAYFWAGGWAWARHFAFPILFVCVALPWPGRIEQGLTQGLMQVVSAVTVELLGTFNIAAVQRGNLIEIATGVVGINEACSGIRSMQSTLMCALLLGELYRLRIGRRAALVLAGIALAFCFNVLRTFLLTWQASRNGPEAVDAWHDSAGVTITVACLFVMWALTLLLKPKGFRNEGVPPRQESVAVPGIYLVAMGCWSVVILGATEAWYRSRDPAGAGHFQWSAGLPSHKPEFRVVELTDREKRIMGHDSGAAAMWNESDGSQWTAYFFRWNPMSIQSVMRSRAHRPDVCLPAAGWQQVADEGISRFHVAGLDLPFRKYTYATDGQEVHVFFCQWEDGTGEQHGMGTTKHVDRLRTALGGRRRLGQQTLELIISGHPTMEKAEEAVRNALPEIIRVTNL